jgi:hypothetical protein
VRSVPRVSAERRISTEWASNLARCISHAFGEVRACAKQTGLPRGLLRATEYATTVSRVEVGEARRAKSSRQPDADDAARRRSYDKIEQFGGRHASATLDFREDQSRKVSAHAPAVDRKHPNRLSHSDI